MNSATGSANAGATLVLDVDTSSADRKLMAIAAKLKALEAGGGQAQNDKVKRLEKDVTELKAALEASQAAMTAYEAKLKGLGSGGVAAAKGFSTLAVQLRSAKMNTALAMREITEKQYAAEVQAAQAAARKVQQGQAWLYSWREKAAKESAAKVKREEEEIFRAIQARNKQVQEGLRQLQVIQTQAARAQERGNQLNLAGERAVQWKRIQQAERMAMLNIEGERQQHYQRLKAQERGNQLNLAGERAVQWKRIQQAERMAMLNIEGERQQHYQRLKAQERASLLNATGQRQQQFRDTALAYNNALISDQAKQYDALGRRIFATQQIVQRFGEAQARAFLGARAGLVDQIPNLDRYVKATGQAGAAARDATLHTHAFNLAQQTTHATLRGVTGVLGGLWLSYAKLVPVLLAAAAATKSVKDSITGGLDTTFQAQFIATVDTKGFSQGEALRGIRETILKDLTNVARDSVFTVEENAEALHKLSLAGVDASRGIGLLKTASDAAVFAQKGLGETTAMVLDTLYNFGLASQDPGIMAENFERAANIMSYTAISVNASFDDIAKSFTNITGVAGSFNIQIEEASALLANLAQTGIRGQKAGTYVRNFLDDLMGTPISLRAEKAMKAAGIGRYDPSAETEYGASKYIDDAVSKIKQLSFIEQQDFLRAATNQRSRRVWRQELISSYNEETTLLRRVSELAEKAEGSLANMAKGLKDSGKMSILMAQSAYNASVIGAYQSTEADLGFQEIGKRLQTTFNSDEFKSLMKSIVASTLEVLKALTSLFDYVVKNQDAIKTALSAAFDVAVIIGFGAAFSKTISFVASAIDKATKALVAFKAAQAAAAAGSMMTGVAAAGSIVGAGILGIHYLESKKLDHSAKSLEDVNAEMAELERRVKNLNASNDYTGYAEVEIADLERRLASLRAAAKEKAAVETDDKIKQSVQSITQTLENEAKGILEIQAKVERVLNAGLYKGDDALSLRLSTTKRTLEALSQVERKYGDEIAKIQARIQELREKGASDAKIDEEVRKLQGLTQAAYGTSEAIDNLQSQMATAIEKSVFAKISEDAKKAGLDSTSAIKEMTEGYDKLFREAIIGEEALTAARRRSSEEGAAQMLAWAAALEAQVAGASSPEMASTLAEQAMKARATAEEMKNLANSIDLANQAKAYMAGTGPITQDMIIQLSTTEIQAMADSLKLVADQANLTKEALRALSLTNIMDQAGKAWADGDDARAAALSDLAQQRKAAWEAEDKAAARRGSGGSGARQATPFDEAKTSVQEFKNAYQEALGLLREGFTDGTIGPLELNRRAVQEITVSYEEMLATLQKAKTGSSSKDVERISTEMAKLSGERDKELRKLTQESAKEAKARGEALEALEIEVGKKTLSAADAWLKEYQGKYGETLAKLALDIAELETQIQILEVGADSGDVDAAKRIEELRTKLEALYQTQSRFGSAAELGSYLEGLRESAKKTSDEISNLDDTLEILKDRDSKGGVWSLLGGSAGQINAVTGQQRAAIVRQIATIEKQIEAQGGVEANLDLVAEKNKLERQLDKAGETISPTLEKWGDTLGSFVAEGLVYGFEEGESPLKQFANLLKRELATSLSTELSSFFKSMLSGAFGGGSAGGGIMGSIGSIVGQGAMSLVFGGSGGGGGSALSAASTAYSGFNNASSLYSGGSALAAYGSAASGYAYGTAPLSQQSLMLASQDYGLAGGTMGSGTTALGSIGAGLAGGLWAYNQTGSYTAGVAGAAGSTALYGAAAGYMAGGSAAAAGAGVSSALGTLGPWGWVALAVVAILGDILTETPDPRLTYQMAKDLKGSIFEDQVSPEAAKNFLSPEQYAEWQKTYADTEGVPLQAVAKGAFGYVGLHSYSKDVDAKDLKQQFEALAQLDNAIASGLKPEEVEAVRNRMDGWVSSYGTRRDQDAALEERLWAIIEGIGGETEADLKAFDAASTNATIEKLRTKWLAEQQLALDRLQLTTNAFSDYYAALGADGGASEEIARRTAEIEKAKSLTAQEWLEYARTLDSDSVTASMLANPDSNGSWGMRNPEYDGDQSASMQQLIERLMKVIFIDDLQEGLGKMGQTIGKDAALAWMDTAKFTVVGQDAEGKETKTELTGFAAVAAQLQQVHAILYASPLDGIKAQWEAFSKLFKELGEDTIPSNVVAFQKMMEGIDLNAESGRNLYLNLAQLAPQVVQIQEALLGLLGTNRASLVELIGSGLSGRAPVEEIRTGLETAVVSGIRSALSVEVANQITDLMVGGIVNPAIEAMLLGGDVMKALNAASIEATVAEIEARVAAFEAVMSSPEVQAALGLLSSSMSRVANSMSNLASRANEAAERTAAIETAQNNLRNAYKQQAQDLQSTIDRFRNFAKSLKEFRESLLVGKDSPLSVSGRFAEASRQFNSVSARAQLGDVDAIGELQGISSTYLAVSKEAATSAEDYYREFAKVQRTLLATETVADRQATLAQRQLDTLTSQVSALIQIDESVLSVRDAIIKLLELTGGKAVPTNTTPSSSGGTGGVGGIQNLNTSASGAALSGIKNTGGAPLKASDVVSEYYWLTSDQQAKSGGWTGASTGVKGYAKINGTWVPQFASGGDHKGGLRIVGEKGWELEATGPSRIWSFEQTKQMLNGGGNNAGIERELKALRAELEILRAASETTARNTHSMRKLQERWDGNGLPQERVA